MRRQIDGVVSYTDVVLAVHGGAGVLRKDVISDADQEQYLFHLAAALEAGYKKLTGGATAIDAVESAVRYLEDCPLFNAGKGAVLNELGKAELDAAVMDGKTRAAGAIACVKTVKNPVAAARAVMEKTEHVLLVGPGADQFAKETGLEIVDPQYFWTEKQQHRLEEEKQKSQKPHAHHVAPSPAPALSKYGTVGAVAVDAQKNLAAATSTGGTTNKKYGRVGDSPIIGSGTYADNETCAVSCTGHGEFFMRWVAGYDVSALIKYAKMSVVSAAELVINKTLKSVGGSGGLIALDADGNCALPFNSEGMFRGCVTKSGDIHVAIFGD
jgi:beta-aspartyl-peptidase (threonine type)